LARRWLAKLVTTLAAWLAAYLLVLALLSVLGDELGSLPLAVRALVISGVLVTAMTTLVMPALSVAVNRWLAGSSHARAHAMDRRSRLGDQPGPRDARELDDRATQG
jgi:antibiotic biosynthesis monooxygenase (ABM) superfamily enzyme